MSMSFQSINAGYNATFNENKLSLGLVVPLENYAHSSVPTMHQQIERIQLAEKLGFAAVWLRDVPFNVPSFGDAGQVYDPFVYLGVLSAMTSKIALGVASMVLPLRHPAHVAKSAASVDQLSNGRLILGIASGDRPDEYPAMNIPFDDRGSRFRDSYEYIRKSWKNASQFTNQYGELGNDLDILPKPVNSRFPMLITGSSQQNETWLTQNGDGFITYPRTLHTQEQIINRWRQVSSKFGQVNKPVMQPLYIDIQDDDNAPMEPIHLGFRNHRR
ncbi:LLM class oxidoreductase [Paraglaciecola marina]|uniref:LLM class oxidoreductase n=1 Tax=Paraglaciecola marina TaxID=2500157 RepID=UPI00197D0659|nr:LLM class oxidoreductase [Paraglaciecola marina]